MICYVLYIISATVPHDLMQARMVCLVPLVMSLHYIILICHFTSHHFTSLHITSLHITSYDIMVISDIMGHVGVMLWHLKGHQGDWPAGPPWLLHEARMILVWLGRVKFWHIFWRPFLEAPVGQHVPKGCQNDTKKYPTSITLPLQVHTVPHFCKTLGDLYDNKGKSSFFEAQKSVAEYVMHSVLYE